MARRGFRYPPEHVVPRRTPIAGIAEILEALRGDHWSAWRFLAEQLPELAGMTGFKALAAEPPQGP